MDQYNPYVTQFSTAANPYLMQHQMQIAHSGHHQQQMHGSYGYPSSGIDYPGMNDVMCGRGGGTNNHIGNIRFRQLVNEHKLRYLAAPKVDKPRVAMEVVVMWRALDPPGRFLTKTDAAQGDDSLWHDVGDKKAREKASQCLRERTPDVMPFVKQLQEEEKKKKEEDKRLKDGTEEDKVEETNVLESAADSKVADIVVSNGNRTPEPTLSGDNNAMLPPPPQDPSTPRMDNKGGKKRRTREDYAAVTPTANTFEDVFDDDLDDNGVSLEAYQNEMHDFLEKAPKGDASVSDDYSVGERSLLMMETMSTASWVKPFQSFGSGLGHGSTMMLSMNGSLRDIEHHQDVLLSPDMKQEKSTRTQRVNAIWGHNSLSMMSDVTDFKSTRSSKMGASRAPSNFSMTSELTDLSEGMRTMDVHRDL